MCDTGSQLYNELLEIYFDKYNELNDAKINKMDTKYDSNNLFHKTYNYDLRFENEESTVREESVDLSDMAPLETYEGENEGKKLKILTPNN